MNDFELIIRSTGNAAFSVAGTAINGNNVGGFYLAEDETDDEKKSEE